MVRSFAAQAGVVLDTEANRQRLTELSVLEEQERIGRDLHDTVVQQVFAVGLSLQGTINMARDPEVAARISGAVDTLDAVIRQIRTVIFDVSPPTLTATGLRGEVQAVVREVSRGLGFEPAVRFDGSVDAIRDRDIRRAAVAVLREALSNVARHARATEVQVDVVVAEGCLVLRVRDDGLGLSVDPVSDAGKGLRNMRSRAEQVGGTFDIHPGPDGTGTVLEWMAPYS
jgi:signal transduction histidine kinase